jgi:ribosomal-protein-alanine N-acetyltransferase
LRRARTAYAAGTALALRLYLADDPERMVGDVSLTNIARGPFQACYLGYRLDRQSEGRGLMSEALKAVIAHAFGALKLHRIMANYVPTNERSARVLRRLGFVVEGYARDYLFLEGRWKDHCLTSLTNSAHRFE